MSRSSDRPSTHRLVPGARFNVRALTVAVTVAAATGLATLGTAAASATPTASPSFPGSPSGTVYTETNQATNDVLAYRTGPGGTLTLVGTYPTGGAGTGTAPASQGGVTLGDNGTLLAVVNGGSNSVSVFAVSPSGALNLLETNGSGGVDPISVTVHGNWVYALNAGSATAPVAAPNIDGFIVGNPFLRGLSDAQPLNPAASSPEEVAFSPNGRDLVVTEKASNTVDVFPVNSWGVAGPVVTTTLSGAPGPYGFEFTPNGLAVVSEAAIGGVATFAIAPNGTVAQVSQVLDGQMAPCWVALTPNGNEAFAANAHSGNISAFWVAPNGALTLVAPNPQTSLGVPDLDLAVGGNNSLYVSDQPNFDSSVISPQGTLSPATPVVTGLPTGTFGLAATTPNGPGI